MSITTTARSSCFSAFRGCPNCLNKYDDGKFKPVCLSCGHLFCENCVRHSFFKSVKRMCPSDPQCPECHSPIHNTTLVQHSIHHSKPQNATPLTCQLHKGEALQYTSGFKLLCVFCALELKEIDPFA